MYWGIINYQKEAITHNKRILWSLSRLKHKHHSISQCFTNTWNLHLQINAQMHKGTIPFNEVTMAALVPGNVQGLNIEII